jgi:hypothetical protein
MAGSSESDIDRTGSISAVRMNDSGAELDFSGALEALDALAGSRVAVAMFPGGPRADGPAVPAVVVAGVLGALETPDDEAGHEPLPLSVAFFPVDLPNALAEAPHPHRPGFSLSAASFAGAGWMGGGLRVADRAGGYVLIEPLGQEE